MTQVAMSPQQRRFSATEGGRLQKYKELIVGHDSWAKFLGFELYNLCLSNIPAFLGLGLRTVILPKFLKSAGKGLVVGRGVGMRGPSSISVGRGVIIEDYANIDVRTGEQPDPNVGIEMGDHVFVGKFTNIVARNGRVKLGTACNISGHCRIATDTNVEIGESVLIAAYCYIGPGNHRSTDTSTPIIEQGMESKGGVKIGNNCWIGARATIVDGVTLGNDVIVGAHSLVLESVPDRAVVVGSPAKVIRVRD